MLSKRVRHSCSSDSDGESSDDKSDSVDTTYGHELRSFFSALVDGHDLRSFFSALVAHANHSRISNVFKLNVARLSAMFRVGLSRAQAPRPPVLPSGVGFGFKQRLILYGRAQLHVVLVYRLLRFKSVMDARKLLRLAESVLSRCLKVQRATCTRNKKTLQVRLPKTSSPFDHQNIVYHPSGRHAAIGLGLWELNRDCSPASCVLPLECVVRAFHPSGRYFTSGMDLWAVNEGFSAATLLVTLPSATSASGILAFHPSGRYLATAEVQKNVINGKAELLYITKLWVLKEDCGAATCVLVLPPETEVNPYGSWSAGSLHSLRASFHPSGRHLATGHHNLKMWALKDDCSEATPLWHVSSGSSDHITHMAFHPSRLYLVITTYNSYCMRKTFPCTELFAVEADCSEIEVICRSQRYSF